MESIKKQTKTINEEVESLFTEPAIPTDLATQYMDNLLENLTTTEKAIQKDLSRIILLFLGFLILDSGIVETVSVVGTQVKRSGYIVILFPFVISFFYYEFQSRVTFAHEIRTCLALLSRKLHRNLYLGFFDLLLHYPSIRNIETYQSKGVSGSKERFIVVLTTWTVTLVLAGSPIIAVVYTLYRARKYSDLPGFLWIVIMLASAVFILRALIIGGSSRGHALYGERE